MIIVLKCACADQHDIIWNGKGFINGATCYVVYSTPGGLPEYYTYSFLVDDNTVIEVVIGKTDAIYFKSNGDWVAASKVFKKVSGVWVEQTDLTSVFDSTKNYIKS